MTQATNDAKLELIRKLLVKAEANGTTPEEREALSEKAGALMIKYGIDEAIARATMTGEVRIENVVQRLIHCDVPKSYSHEFAVLGCRIAENFSVKGILALGRTQTGVYLIGFESDVELVVQLYASLVRQCTLNLAVWYRRNKQDWWNGSQRWNAKRGYIHGFGTGVGAKLQAIKKQVVADAGHGAELVLINRDAQVQQWLDENMPTALTRGRRYVNGAHGAGYVAGQQANVGQSTVANHVPSRPAIGG